MRTAKVKVIRVQGHNKTTHKSGDVVNEKHFPEGNFEKLVKGGYLQEIDPEEATEESPAKVKEKKK